MKDADDVINEKKNLNFLKKDWAWDLKNPRFFWINEYYFSVCLSIADDSIYYYILYYFEETKKYPENNRIFVQMTIKQSLMILN